MRKKGTNQKKRDSPSSASHPFRRLAPIGVQKKKLFPLSTGNLASFVGVQILSEPPFAWNLPAPEAPRDESSQVRGEEALISVNAGYDVLDAGGIVTRNSKDDAVAHPRA
jgi:hypothetical protein